MIIFYILLGLVVAIIATGSILKLKFEIGGDEEIQYKYKRRNFFMTRAEHECYDALVETVGQEYYIFAQVHLSTLIDHTVQGQDWRAALAHINRKSVDFVLCDKVYISPKLAIELDDKSHERLDRQDRDREVERILRGADIPLLRLENRGVFNSKELAQQIRETLNPKPLSL